MSAPLILALDISKTRTGIAFGRAGERPTFLSIRGDDVDTTAAVMRLGTWLIEWANVERPDYIYFEAPIDRVMHAASVTITLAKMVGVVEFIAGMKKIPARSAKVQTARKAFLGNGYPDNPKQHAKAMCQALGWEPANLDEADAGAVFYFAALQVAPRQAEIVTPMMQAKVATEVEAAMAGKGRARA